MYIRMRKLLLTVVLCGCVLTLCTLAHGQCETSSDGYCASVNRLPCDPSTQSDLCGACVTGMKEGTQPGDKQPLCEPVTCKVAPSDNAVPIQGQAQVVQYGTSVTFACKDGFVTSNTRVKNFAMICADEGFLVSDSTCVPVTCTIPNDVLNASPQSSTPIPLGASVTYTCSPGYAADSRPAYNRTCLPSGSLSAPTNCTDIDACVGVPCGEAALCVDMPAPSLEYTCRCKPGYLGTAAKDGSGCYRLGFKPANDRVVLTAADLTLYHPVKDTRLSITGILDSLGQASAAAQAFNPLLGNVPLSARISTLHSTIDGAVASVAGETSTAISRTASLQAATVAETSRASGAERTLQTSATTQATDIATHRASIAAEISRALAAEASISTALGARIDAVVSSVNSEITRATQAETSLQSRTNLLSNTATTLRIDLTNEVTRAQGAEAAVSAGVVSLAASLSALSSTVAVLSTLHSTTLSMATSASVATVAEVSRATSVQTGLAASINTLRTDLTGTQTTLASVSGTVSSRVPTLASLSTSISSVALQVTSLATAMTALQASTAAATTSYATMSTQINTANNDITSQSTLITTVSNAAATTSTTQASLSTTVSTLTDTINTVNVNLGSLNTRVNTMSATTCDAANANLLYQFNAAGTPLCSAPSQTYLRNWFNAKCWMSIGWRDSCNGCGLTPAKVASMYANGNCRTSVGAANTCGIPAGWASINTDGDVNDDDNFYVQIGCDV